MEFPLVRMRRRRLNSSIRDFCAQTTINPCNLIQPYFVIEGQNAREEIKSMPGVFRLSIDQLLVEISECRKYGIKSIMLFPSIAPELKNAEASEAFNENNLLCRAIKAIKKTFNDVIVFADVALDPYTAHGHDGIVDDEGYVLNDDTIDALVAQSFALVNAGCDVLAPSDMMDGRIGIIREELEEQDHVNTMIASYSAKYASNFYGPFRDAVKSTQKGGIDKKTYQMDYRNSDEALKEIELDVMEGADFIIIKPGMPYLDIVRRAREEFNIPIISYHVSGEYTMLKLAHQHDAIDYDCVLMESLIAFRRAGCTAIITYGALDAAKILNKKAV